MDPKFGAGDSYQPEALGGRITPEQPVAYGMAYGDYLSISIQKTDNGFFVSLYDPPKQPTQEEIDQEIKEQYEHLREQMEQGSDGKGLDERVDAMVDGLIAFQKHIMDRSTGEEWKGDDAKEKIREGFKVMFPQLAGDPRRLKIYQGLRKPPKLPRQEQMVFQTVDQLVEYLKKNLGEK